MRRAITWVYWLPKSPPTADKASPNAYLLSIYDEYISSYKDRSAICEPEIGARLIALGNALSYVVVVDGQIVGTWKRMLGGKEVVIKTNYLTRLTEVQYEAVAIAAQCYGEFLNRSIALA